MEYKNYYEYRNAQNKKLLIILLVAILVIAGLSASAIQCKHESVDYVIVVEPTCTEKGEGRFICNDCEVVLEVYYPSAISHDLGEYTVTTEPSPNTNGEESANCTRCEYVDKREFVCPHVAVTDIVAVEPTCTEVGRMDTLCDRCSTVLAENPIEAKGHNVEEFEITVKPTPDKNGVQEGTCVDCGLIIEQEYICPHENTKNDTIKSATCQAKGEVNVICELCEKVLKTKQTDIVECSYGDWKTTKAATPTEDGTKTKTCKWCGDTKTKTYSLDLGSNYVYVAGTDLQKKITVASFTQGSVDKYDIVYNNSIWGSDNPFILGHNTGSMRALSQVDKGDIVYVSVNGNVKKYKVVVSEFAMQNSAHNDMIGQTTGHSIWDNLGGETLHMYTCYGSNRNGRWMVLAIRI